MQHSTPTHTQATDNLTCIVKHKHWSHSKNVPPEVHQAFLGVNDNESKHTIQHSRRGLYSKPLVEMNNDLAVALSVEAELVLISQGERVVYLPVVQEPYVRENEESHGLHPLEQSVDSQSLEAQAGIRRLWNRLNPRGVWSTVAYLETFNAPLSNVFISETKQCPNTAHVCCTGVGVKLWLMQERQEVG